MTLQSTMQPHEAARMGESILAESKRLADENESLKEKLLSLEGRVKELDEKYKKLKEFEPLLDDAPTAIQVYLDDKNVVRKLQAAAIRFYKRAGQHPDTIEGDEKLKRLARMNYKTIVTACIDHGCGAGWNLIVARYLKQVLL